MTLRCASCGAIAPGHEGQVPRRHPVYGTGPDGPDCTTKEVGLPLGQETKEEE